MAGLLGRVETRGPGPVFQAAVRAHEDEALQKAARDALHDRLVEPLRRRYENAGTDRPQLRAELAVAAFAGVALGRASGSFTALAVVPVEELIDLLQELLSGG